MKKILYLLILCFSFGNLSVKASDHPEANFGEYGIQKCATLSEYQKYVGETVIYLPKTPPSYDDTKEFKGVLNKEYVITKITGNDKKMKFILQEKGGTTKVKMIVNNQYEMYSYGEYTYCITGYYSIPLFLVDKFNQDKAKLIGKKYTNDKVKTVYECTDVIMTTKADKYATKTPYPTLHYVLQNSITAEKDTFPAEKAEKECFIKDLSGKYISTLVKVEKPADETVRYGKTKSIESEGMTKYSYIDDYIDIVIFGGREQFNFVLKNISQNTLKIVWNEAVFVNFNGSTSKIMHVGTKYSQKDGDQPASTIIKGASIDDIAVPTCNIRYSDVLKEWITESMYPNSPAISPGELRLMLPIQVKDVVNEYIFVFKVEWIYNHPELIKS
ncbi:MAG: hypothetical protein ACYC2P_12795 [Paludibacteraceae bacterium]